MGRGSEPPAVGIPVISPYPPQHQPQVVFVTRDSRGCGSWTCNLLWLFFGGGIIMGLLWGLAACLLCATLVFIPCGLQLFKISGFMFLPFGKTLERSRPGCSCPEAIGNILWLPVGLIMFAAQAATGVALCLSIIGIPFGIQHIKLSLVCLWPFGTEVSHYDVLPTIMQPPPPPPTRYAAPPVV